MMGSRIRLGSGCKFFANAANARGLPGSHGTSMTCTSSPWAGITSPPPATILLPAGTIVIPSGWVLPPSTRVIGVGNGDVANSSGTSYSGTTIQACKSGQSGCGGAFSGTMISMCSSACSGVSIESLSLDGQGQSLTGSSVFMVRSASERGLRNVSSSCHSERSRGICGLAGANRKAGVSTLPDIRIRG